MLQTQTFSKKVKRYERNTQVSESKVKLNYTNVMTDDKDDEHRITKQQLYKILDELPKKIERLRSFPKARKSEDAYKKLPHNTQVVRKIEGLIAKVKDGVCFHPMRDERWKFAKRNSPSNIFVARMKFSLKFVSIGA